MTSKAGGRPEPNVLPSRKRSSRGPRGKSLNKIRRHESSTVGEFLRVQALRFTVQQSAEAIECVLALVNKVEYELKGPFAKRPVNLTFVHVLQGLAEIHLATSRIRAAAMQAIPEDERQGL